MKVHTLITAIALDQEDVDLTVACYNSFMGCKTSFVNDVSVDTRLHPKDQALTGKWNDFINFYRGKDYGYLLICANDTLAHPDALEYMVKLMEDNPDMGVIHSTVNRDRTNFDTSLASPIEYTPSLHFDPSETANMILRKGVIEKVGEFDLLFPHEYNERDYFYRCKLAGFKLGTSSMGLFYHPNHSQDDPNRQGAWFARDNYIGKWGGDWMREIYECPFNNGALNFTHTKQNG